MVDKIPEPSKVNVREKEAAPIVAPPVEALVPLPKVEQGTSLMARVRHLWSVVEPFAEAAARTAEEVMSGASDADKRQFVTNEVLDLLKDLEAHNDFIPDWIQPLVFRALRVGVGFVVDRALMSVLKVVL